MQEFGKSVSNAFQLKCFRRNEEEQIHRNGGTRTETKHASAFTKYLSAYFRVHGFNVVCFGIIVLLSVQVAPMNNKIVNTKTKHIV